MAKSSKSVDVMECNAISNLTSECNVIVAPKIIAYNAM